MKTMLLALICMAMLAGCATTGTVTPSTDISARAERIKIKADRMAVIGGKIVKRAGPLIAAGVCVAAPEYCVAAKAAYKAANVTIAAIHAAKEADDGLKLAALGEEFAKNITTINEVLTATGQEKIDLTEFQATTKELQAATQ